jgi:hypothetical protein
MKEDPYNALGFGMVAYRDLMLTLMCLWGACSLLMAPALHYYSSGSGYGGSYGSYDKYSLGNFGYSTTECQTVPVDLNKITMECTYGVISDIYYIGINPSNMSDKDTCSPSDYNAECTVALNITFLELVESNITSGDLTSSYSYTYTSDELWDSSVTVPSTCSGFKATLYM